MENRLSVFIEKFMLIMRGDIEFSFIFGIFSSVGSQLSTQTLYGKSKRREKGLVDTGNCFPFTARQARRGHGKRRKPVGWKKGWSAISGKAKSTLSIMFGG